MHNKDSPKRVAFLTFGCRLNQYDTETLRTLLEEAGGWYTVPAKQEADVYVVNTCSVTARADASARKAIRRVHAARPGAKIVVTGCYAQRAPEEIAELPGVSLIVGAANRQRIVSELDESESGKLRIAVSPIADAKEFLDVSITEMMEHSRAFVKVQEGCDESCSFCIVPQTRGRSRSRRPERVLQQVYKLVDRGYVEIVVTGVHVGDYGLDLPEKRRLLPALIREILLVPGLERFRLSSIEPSTVTEELIDLMASEHKFARHFHVPFQSGSDEVLARMRRCYTVKIFSELMWRITEAVPGCGIGTDVICGFPGETDAQFQQTFDRLVELPITYVHPFTYSIRPGSAAEAYGDQVSGDVKKRRTRSLKRLSRDKNRAFCEQHVGDVMSVLLEGGRQNGETTVSGWTDNYLRVNLGPGTASGRLENVCITGVSEDGLKGERPTRNSNTAHIPTELA